MATDHSWTAKAMYERLFGGGSTNEEPHDLCCKNCVVFEQAVIKENLLKPTTMAEEEDRTTYHFWHLKISEDRLLGEQHICNCHLSKCHCPCPVCDVRRLTKTHDELNIDFPRFSIHKLIKHPALLMTTTKTPNEDLIEGGANLCAFQFTSELQPFCICKCVRAMEGARKWCFYEPTAPPTMSNLLQSSTSISGCCCPCEWCKLSPLLEIIPDRYPFSSSFPCSMIDPSSLDRRPIELSMCSDTVPRPYDEEAESCWYRQEEAFQRFIQDFTQ